MNDHVSVSYLKYEYCMSNKQSYDKQITCMQFIVIDYDKILKNILAM